MQKQKQKQKQEDEKVENTALERKTPEEKASAVSAFLNTARLMGGRATFMAGFSYYSVGRYMFSCCESKAYFFFNILALVMSMMTAGFSAIYVYYAQRITDPELAYEFCIQALVYNRLVFRCSIVANTCYTIGIGLLPWAYYQQSDMKWFTLLLLTAVALVWWPVAIKIAVSQLKLQHYGGYNSGVELVDYKEILASSHFGSENRSESLQSFLLKQANIVSSRAVFIAGLAQQGIMRFMPDPVVYGEDDHPANAFLVFVSIAFAASYFSGNVFLLFQVFIPDTVKLKQLAFAIMIYPIANIFFACYIFGFLALFLGNMFSAYGCNFEKLQRTTIFFGFLGLFMVAQCLYKGSYRLRTAEEDEKLKAEFRASALQVDEKLPSESRRHKLYANISLEKQLENIFLAINTAGSMSTFAAGYLFYNIMSYESDVLRLPRNEQLDLLVRSNLIANMVTVTVALYASVADTILSLNVNKEKTVQDKLNYFQARMWIVHSIIYGYYLSLVGWFVCFGFFGFVKYTRYSYVPFGYAVAGVIVMVIGTVYVHWARKSIDIDNPKVSSTTYLTSGEIAVSISRPSNLTSLGFSVIFLGGFAYFAINFFNFRDRPYENLYLHSMCICFMTSMWVMVFGDRYNYQISKCPTDASKLAFSEKTYTFYCLTLCLSYLVVLSLLIGFNFLGYIKSISNYKDINKAISFGITIVGVFCIPMVYWILSTFKAAVFAKDPLQATVKKGQVERFKNQIIAGLSTSGFIAGNVCYELLFAEANSDYMWLNQYYFLTMSFAFAFGVSVVIVSTLIILCMGELTTLDKKEYFVATLNKAKMVIFILSIGCILSWQASILALSNVKYSGDKGGDLQSFIVGIFGLISVAWVFFDVKRISDDILRNGRTVTAAAIESKPELSKLESQNATATVLNPMVSEASDKREDDVL